MQIKSLFASNVNAHSASNYRTLSPLRPDTTVSESSGKKSIDSSANVALGRFPFVRTDRPVHSRRNDNFIFDQSYPSRSIKSLIAGTKEMAETLGERPVQFQNEWSGHGPAGQF